MSPAWNRYFNASKTNDLLEAFESMVELNMMPVPLHRDAKGKVKKPAADKDWGIQSIEDRRELLIRTIRNEPKNAGLGCQPFGHIVFDCDPPNKDPKRIQELLDDIDDIVFGGEVYETLVVTGEVGIHIWFKTTPQFQSKYNQARKKVDMPCGGHVEIFVGTPSGQTQVACAPSEGKTISQEIEPANLPEVASEWLLDLVKESKNTVNNVDRCEYEADQGSWESQWFVNRSRKLINNIILSQPGNLHFTLRAMVRTIAGYAAGMGLEYEKNNLFGSIELALQTNGNCHSFKCAKKTMEWAWSRGVSLPMAPEEFKKKKGRIVSQPEPQKPKYYDPENDRGDAWEPPKEKNDLIPYHDPFLTAEEFVKSEGLNRFITWHGSTWQWRLGKYNEIRGEELKSMIGSFTDHWYLINIETIYSKIDDPDEKAKVKKKPVTSSAIQSVNQAFNSLTTIPERKLPCMPYWIDRHPHDWDPIETIALRNCLLNVRTKETMPLTNRWFSRVRSNVEWLGSDQDCPVWKEFLQKAFPNDQKSIELLQMFFGLCLTSNTTFQKILALLGPPRSGKGTTCRTLSALLGAESVASLALGDLAREFGLEKLIGMPVAIMPDVRFGNRDNVSDAIERMLSISGEDEIRIARKYQPDWSGKLPTRIIMASNEMPRLPDAAAALPTRLLVLQFVESHVGKEDLDLPNKLQKELPGILAWSVEGYSKLLENKGFPENDSTLESVEEAKEIASPMHAFLSDCFEFQSGATAEIQITDVYELYKRWCADTGRTPACVQIMSKQIKDLNPKLRTVRPGGKNNDRKRCFSGMNYSTFGHQLKLKMEAERKSF